MRILAVITHAKVLHLTDGTEFPSGFWGEELAVPYALLQEAGCAVDIATIDGVVPMVDASSLDPSKRKWFLPPGVVLDPAAAERCRRILEGIAGLKAPLNVGDVTKEALARYDGLFISGGHGCMTDMPASHQMARLLLRALSRKMPIGSICHGPAAFLAPRDAEGRNPFRGYRVTCYSQAEDALTPHWGRVPLVLQWELEGQGLIYSRAEAPGASHVVRDRNLVTGQNPGSSAAFGAAFLALLRESSPVKA
jgi:putative intracellular protease/amidase